MTRVEVVKRLQAGAELRYEEMYSQASTAWALEWKGTISYLPAVTCKHLVAAGLVTRSPFTQHYIEENRRFDYYRWSGPTPATGTDTPPTPLAG